jgi:N-acetylglutamate synthase-like GNAT family acetyltransferase
MLPDVCIRQAVDADRGVLQNLVAQVCAEPPVRSFFDTRNSPLVLDVGCAMVAQQNHALIGMAAWAQDETIAVLTGIVVRADRRRFGVATALLHAVVDHLRNEGARLIDVAVGAQLPGVCALFENVGFRVVDRSVVETSKMGWVHLERRLMGRRMQKS